MHNKYRRVKKHKKENISEINVVPYIDVMLVLLVVFMLTAPLLYHNISIKLPETKSTNTVSMENKFLIIDVLDNNLFDINYSGKTEASIDKLPLDKIATYLKENNLEQVFIRSDKDIRYGKVISTMDILKKNKISNIGLITKKDTSTND